MIKTLLTWHLRRATYGQDPFDLAPPAHFHTQVKCSAASLRPRTGCNSQMQDRCKAIADK
eukprot:871267-Alexandrium_andersonii.AAC.1